MILVLLLLLVFALGTCTDQFARRVHIDRSLTSSRRQWSSSSRRQPLAQGPQAHRRAIESTDGRRRRPSAIATNGAPPLAAVPTAGSPYRYYHLIVHTAYYSVDILTQVLIIAASRASHVK